MGDIKETMDRIRKQAEEMYNEKMKLLDEHKYEEIKQKIIDTKKAKQFTNIEDKAIISMEFIEDMQFLIDIIDTLEKKSIQDDKKYLKIKEIVNSRFFEFSKEFGEFYYQDFVIKSKIEELKDLINE